MGSQGGMKSIIFFSLYDSELFDLLNKVSFVSNQKRKQMLL